MNKQIDTPTNTPTNTPTQNQFTNYESKQIEEMEKIVSNCIQKWLNNDTTKSISCYVSEEIYNAGYRRASDLAREIFEEIEKCFFEELVGQTEAKLLDDEMFAELRKKYIGADTNVTTKESEGGE